VIDTYLKRFLVPVLVLLVLAFILFLINQISGVYLLLADFSPLVAKIVLVVLIVLAVGLLASPFFLWVRMPSSIQKPRSESEVPRYQQTLAKRLQSNQHLKEYYKTEDVNDLEKAVLHLDQKADKIIKDTATTVFLTTSVSQNGKLDALTVFTTQMRMIWKVAHIYYQRPGVKELASIYSSVGLNSFVASEIEDLDISQQIEPVAAALFKNASGKAVPWIGPSATLIMDSLMEGSTNAFLTLRVGILTRKYCGHLGVWDPKAAKRSTYREAAVMLKTIAMSASTSIIRSILSATKDAGLDSIKSSWQTIKNTGAKIYEGVTSQGRKLLPKKEEEITQED
jgi:hypothetical protein